MTRGYSLKCSVCQGEFLSKSQWSLHLTEKKHRLLAREECLREWDQREIKQCCLVVYSSFSMEGPPGRCTGAEKVIRYFSQKASTFVTDVVWWKDRPCVAVVQFESRKKLKEVISSQVHSMEVEIGGERILVKPAVDLTDLEWFAILPMRSDNAIVSTMLSSPVLQQEPKEEEGEVEETDNDNRLQEDDEIRLDASTPDSVCRLTELTKERGWELPEFTFFKPNAPHLPKYLCSVIVNGVEYKPTAKLAGAETKIQAKMKTAEFCYETVTSRITMTPSVKRNLEISADDSQEDEFSKRRKLDEVSASRLVNPREKKKKDPVSKLAELVEQSHWPEPVYVFKKITRPGKRLLYSCNVIVNGVEYKWLDSTEKIVPCRMMQAKIRISKYCLELLTLTSAAVIKESVPSKDSTIGSSVPPKNLQNSQEGECSKGRKLDKISVSSLDTRTTKVEQDPMVMLAELVRRYDWPEPVYLFNEKIRPGKRKLRPLYTCNVIVNAVEYKWSDITPKVFFCGRDRAKMRISSYCVKLLTLSSADVNTESVALNDNTIHSSPPPKNVPSDSLQHQFWHICNSMRIPDAAYQTAVGIEKRVNHLLSQYDPTAKAVLFRNWHLKLWSTNASTNPVLIYVYLTKPQEGLPSSSYSGLPSGTVTDILNGAPNEFSVMVYPENSGVVDGAISTEQQEWTMRCKQSGTIFWVTNIIGLMAEVQVCHMVKYMCEFDPRCHSLLALAKYWAATNKVNFGQADCKEGKYPFHTLLGPHSLEWMMMFFLCYKGIIPTPREIQQQPHNALHEIRIGIDIGFEESAAFVRDWIATHKAGDANRDDKSTEEYARNVLFLFQEFLEFCGTTLASGQWILNTRDGELIEIHKFLNCKPDDNGSPESSWTTKLTPEELSHFRSIQKSFSRLDGDGKRESSNNHGEMLSPGAAKYSLDLRAWKVYILHPFISSRKVSVGNKIRHTLQMMERAGNWLKSYLNVRQYSGRKAPKSQFVSLKNTLTVVDN